MQETFVKRALVIGGTAGIAAPTISALIEANYDVVFTYNSNVNAKNNICAKFPSCKAVKVDLSNLNDVEAFLDVIAERDVPDVLVVCSGTLSTGISLGNIRSRLETLTAINFLSPAMICASIAEKMSVLRRGTIVIVTSVAAQKSQIGNAVYGSTKAALERFNSTLALEVARFKVRTVCIAPAFVDTEMFNNFAKERREEIIKRTPMREILTPEQVSNAIMAFVQGQLSTTGTTIVLGNGEHVI
jgi:3-oxoacyl-[acyl-carrier protein] reductase